MTAFSFRKGRNVKVELLSPAGNYEGFLGAIHAGADAVYLGGNKFGARAYADNFTTEEICQAIRYAHLHGRKVYLTINTLFKDKELAELEEYLTPFYDNQLDGVIIQDIGAFHYVKEKFPNLELHVSTQMAITGVYGARLLKEMGAARIVPARELSLSEIKDIKNEVEIEIETFIHGAMCYCYSGNCLFSSILGGRSGNRGRCAQPCRLPYQLEGQGSKNKEEIYPLSLKDMCTIENIPKLIEAGIDSFKIEGRMKKPEYTAGVTALYRKYMDNYYANPSAEYHVEQADLKRLQLLYIRSEIQDGYYERHNGKEMVTIEKPSYSGVDSKLLDEIREKYILTKLRIPLQGEVVLEKDKPIQLIIRTMDGSKEVKVFGEVVSEALKKPLDEEAIRKQLLKTGNSNFSFANLKVSLYGNLFLPVKSLNELRREALEQMETVLLSDRKKKDGK